MTDRERLIDLVSDSERFCSVFARWIGRDQVREADRLIDDLEMSSLDMLYLLVSLEELVSVELRNEELDDLTTVGDVRAALARFLGQSRIRRPGR